MRLRHDDGSAVLLYRRSADAALVLKYNIILFGYRLPWELSYILPLEQSIMMSLLSYVALYLTICIGQFRNEYYCDV